MRKPTEADAWRWIAENLGRDSNRWICVVIDEAIPAIYGEFTTRMIARIESYMDSGRYGFWSEPNSEVPMPTSTTEEYFAPKRMACDWLALEAESGALPSATYCYCPGQPCGCR